MEEEKLRKKHADYMRKYMAENPAQRKKRNAYLFEYRKKNKEKAAESSRMYYKNNKTYLDFKNKEWIKNNYKKFRIYQKIWSKANRKKYKDLTVIEKLIKGLRARLWRELKKNKKTSALIYLGCSPEDLKKHLESQWKPEMSWDNYGRKLNKRCWHIDHIKPINAFNMNIEIEKEDCFHYTNLQPLWADENLKKGFAYIKK